jgi:molybdopterin molybdotransferase
MNGDLDTAEFGFAGDTRMKGFRSRTSVEELSAWIENQIKSLPSDEVPLHEAWSRVLAQDIIATEAVPPFDRAAMDGYAVQAESTFGASEYMPTSFQCVGRSRPGLPCDAAAGLAEAVEVATGSPMPSGADAVVPVEATRREGDRVLVAAAVPRGRHVSRRGEDIAPGTVALNAGRVLRPQDVGVLSAVGAARVGVVRRPRVVALITGDELLPAGTPARAYQVPDVNSVMLAALIARDGGTCEVIGPVPDRRAAIRDTILDAASRADLMLISGATSAGPEDHVPGIIAELGRLIAHGLALRPASPTGVGLIGEGQVPVVMLPGNPVSCLCAYDFVAGPMVRRQAGRPIQWPYRSLTFPLARKLTSTIGRVDYARVRIRAGQVEPLSTSGASILSSASRADGFVVVPAGLEGYPPGANVDVWCYDEYAFAANAVGGGGHGRSQAHNDQSSLSAHQTPAG